MTNSPEPSFAGPTFDRLLAELAEMTPALDADDAWPAAQFRRLAAAGVLGWVVPEEFGGSEISDAELTRGYELLAQACVPTTFILTQRNGACLRIAGSDNAQLKAELLPALCRGESFATVGISHLTTSRQHLSTPAVHVERTSTGWRFDGTIPWVTGAIHADYVVTGGTCSDGRQVLAVIPTSLPGVKLQGPVRLMALNASQTGSVVLEAVELEERFLIEGPIEQVMKRGKAGGAGSLATSALAAGLARAALERLRVEMEHRPDLGESYEPLAAECDRLSTDLRHAVRTPGRDPSLSAEAVRQRANSLVLRATQAHLAASKGAGYVRGHAAERAVREAMFFLVWSCPQPVLSAALREFACVLET